MVIRSIVVILISIIFVLFFAKQKLDTEISQNAARCLSRVKAVIATNLNGVLWRWMKEYLFKKGRA
ncbi:hypothetical protein BK135_22235 [Paenibacillus peoriae]|nr:hypothetical protein BK135_22235 [Paenibacillus peoriae]